MQVAEPQPAQAAAPSGVTLPSIRQYGMRAIVVLFTLNAVDEFDRAVLAVALDDIREHFGLSERARARAAVAAVPGLIFGLYALMTLREPRRGESDLQTAVEDNPLLADFLREPENRWGFFESLSTIFGIRTLRYLIFSNAAFGFVLLGIVYWFPTLFERKFHARGHSAISASHRVPSNTLCARPPVLGA